MLPLHTSSLCACTFHLFYNAPALYPLVALQAALTLGGNVTLALAAWRLAERYAAAPPPQLVAPRPPVEPNDVAFLGKTALGSLALAALVKGASPGVDVLFHPTLPAALALVLGGTAATATVFAARSDAPGRRAL